MTFFWGRGQKYNTTADVFEYLSSKKKIYMIFKILFWGGGRRSIQQLENGQKFKIEIDVFFVLVLGQERRITHTRMSFTK